MVRAFILGGNDANSREVARSWGNRLENAISIFSDLNQVLAENLPQEETFYLRFVFPSIRFWNDIGRLLTFVERFLCDVTPTNLQKSTRLKKDCHASNEN